MAPRKKATSVPNSPVSMADLARELGVSMTTVSRALSDHFSIGPEMKLKVQKLAKKYNYQPNRMASALRKGQSKLLGIIVPYLEGRFFPKVVRGMETAASRAGYNVVICQSNEDLTHERRNIESLLSAQVAGILVSVSRTTDDFRHFEKVRGRGLPLVFFDRMMPGDALNAVVLDDREGGYLATRHLLAQGGRRVAHFGGLQQLTIYRNRYQGYRDALAEAGLPVEEELTYFGDNTEEAGAEAMRRWLALPNPPDAVFAAGDYAALGAMQEAERQGLVVPTDMAVGGFSNETFTPIAKPSITTVDQRCDEMGQAAVRLLLELIDAQAQGLDFASRQLVLRPELIIRESSQRLGRLSPTPEPLADAAVQ
ncbi:LacI family transcriptional regulator [Hymenobacter edaphi]|uniref:LacI family transcriptional regulator n=2 Tax=Hymenobacter edaphi TaxID=2211146 RepID=A0A328BTF1_9BACT|nr:LacI family transcriptional regulator [Hymenobacter edaphi]